MTRTPLPISVWAEETPISDPGRIKLDKPEDDKVTCQDGLYRWFFFYVAKGPFEVVKPWSRERDRETERGGGGEVLSKLSTVSKCSYIHSCASLVLIYEGSRNQDVYKTFCEPRSANCATLPL